MKLYAALRVTRTMILALLISPAFNAAADWSDCSSELNRLAQVSRDAADAADGAESAEDEYESAKSTLQLCSEDCDMERMTYKSAKEEYESALEELESAMSDVASAVRRVNSSCQ